MSMRDRFDADMVLGPDRRGLKVTYCTDTRLVPVIKSMQPGQTFICEGMHGEKEKKQPRPGNISI